MRPCRRGRRARRRMFAPRRRPPATACPRRCIKWRRPQCMRRRLRRPPPSCDNRPRRRLKPRRRQCIQRQPRRALSRIKKALVRTGPREEALEVRRQDLAECISHRRRRRKIEPGRKAELFSIHRPAFARGRQFSLFTLKLESRVNANISLSFFCNPLFARCITTIFSISSIAWHRLIALKQLRKSWSVSCRSGASIMALTQH